jgi:Protein of unknown function (DUF3145)
VSVRGVLQVHSAPPALCPHIEWAVAGALGMPVDLPWVSQPAAPGTLRTELQWQAPPGTAAEITSVLAGWHRLRFEVTEEASAGCDAVRYSYTPGLGVFSAAVMANGDVAVPESRLRAALTVAAAAGAGTGAGQAVLRPAGAGPRAAGGTSRERLSALEHELARLLGQPWDDELEPFRCAADGAPVRWLHATG